MQGSATVIVVGNLGRAPELRHTSSGKAVASFSVAVNSGYGDKQRTEWVPVVVWEKHAENCDKYLDKGSPVYVEGRWSTNKWTNREGEERSRVEVQAFKVLFLSGGGGRGADEPPADSGGGAGGEESDDSAIPF